MFGLEVCLSPVKERYRAIKLIGQGGFGRTFLAVDEDKPSKPRCVIKQFFPQAQGTNNSQKAAELFEQEAVRLDDLGKHPHIPELLAYFTQDERQYLVQEFIDGQNLAEALATQGAFREAQIRDLLNSLLPILDFIHNYNVIHRDIKPENIIRRQDGQLVLVDFGAAKFATGTALARTGTVIGSAGYVAPEQAIGKAVFASDLYSLGITCIHLLTQIHPFDLFDIGENTWVWRQYLVNNSVSDELGSVLDRLIENATNRRYQKVSEVLKALNLQPPKVTQQLPPTLQPPSTSTARNSSSTSKPQTQNWRCVQTLTGDAIRIQSLAFSPDGQTLASGSKHGTIEMWQLSGGKLMYTIEKIILPISKSKLDSCPLDLGPQPLYKVVEFNSIAFSPDGLFLASACSDGTVKLWQPDSGKLMYTLTSHSKEEVFSVAFSPDRQTIAGRDYKTIKIWQLGNGKLIHSLMAHSSRITSVAFSPDGQTLASSSSDNTIKLWQLGSYKLIHTLTTHSGVITSIAFSPDGQTLASSNYGKTIEIWQTSTGKLINTVKAHSRDFYSSSIVSSIAFSPDGQTLASGSYDRTIKLWDLRTGEEISTLSEGLSDVKSVAFSPDGQTLAGSDYKTIKIWRRG